MIPLQDTMLIGTLYTMPIQDLSGSTIGQFEQEIRIVRNVFLFANSKRQFIKTTISAYLASAIVDTEVPAEYWRFRLSRELVNELNLPEYMFFGARK